jgi:hypothetical protein
MAATSTTETWDEAWTLTMRAKRKRLTDNISDSYPTVAKFRSSKMMETEVGGKQFQEDLMYALDTSQWFDGDDVLNTDSTDGVTAAFFNPRYVATPIKINMTEEKESQKSDAAMKLLESKTKRAMTTHFDTVNSSLHTAQTGKAIIGLPDIVSTSAGATVGGINSTTNTWWDNVRNDATADTSFLTAAGASFEGLVRMKNTWNSVSEGNDVPDCIITTHSIGGDYESLFEGGTYLRLTGADKNDLDGGNAHYRKAEVIMDRDCGTGIMYMLQSKYLKFKILSGLNFAKTPFREPANQLAKVAFVVLGGQLTTNNRRRQAVIFNIND